MLLNVCPTLLEVAIVLQGLGVPQPQERCIVAGSPSKELSHPWVTEHPAPSSSPQPSHQHNIPTRATNTEARVVSTASQYEDEPQSTLTSGFTPFALLKKRRAFWRCRAWLCHSSWLTNQAVLTAGTPCIFSVEVICVGMMTLSLRVDVNSDICTKSVISAALFRL